MFHLCLKLSIFVIFFSHAANCGPVEEIDFSDITSRITNGRPVGIVSNGVVKNNAEFPYIVSVETADVATCGGSIIRDDVVVTAAHCTSWYPPFMLKVRAGTFLLEDKSGEHMQMRLVGKIVNHPQYNISAYNDNDIAVLFLKSKFNFNNFVNAVNLASQNYAGENAVIIGWGKDEDFEDVQHLKRGDVQVLKNDQCAKLWSNTPGYQITENMICTLSTNKKETICKGDSGGPMIIHDAKNPKNDQLVGITSYGRIINGRFGKRCDTKSPAVYSNVFHLRDWVLSVLRN